MKRKGNNINEFLGLENLFGDNDKKYLEKCGEKPIEDYFKTKDENGVESVKVEEYKKALAKYNSCVDTQKSQKKENIKEGATTIASIWNVLKGKENYNYDYSPTDNTKQKQQERVRNWIIISVVVLVLIFVGYYFYTKKK